jgi:glycosyltransferase involved in cell wall biosynthesis
MKLNKISVIIPCFNMVQYIEATILSIINQNYKNLELIIIDGGSNDGTIDVITKYQDHISYFISENDCGQYDAINKGLKIATGEILAWLNADDTYYPWTLNLVNKIFDEQIEISWISGQSSYLDSDGIMSKVYNTLSCKSQKTIQKGLYNGRHIGYLQQEGMFWRREVVENCGFLNTNLHFAADYELWIRFSKKYELVSVELPLAGFRIRKTSRSILLKHEYEKEVLNTFKTFNNNPIHRTIFTVFNNEMIKLFFMLIIWEKSYVYYFSVRQQRWILTKKFRPVTDISFNQLVLEL